MSEYDEIVSLVERLSSNDSLDFTGRSSAIEEYVGAWSDDELLHQLHYAGVIPETFAHDSTEEKLYAKFCDFVLARAFSRLGLESKALEARGDSADVEAKGPGFSLVADAKAFRLSRTAKNQKDFKVEALDQWRKDADFAVLVGPIYQYPSTRSQIFAQASRYTVLLLSYAHLAFMISEGSSDGGALLSLFQVPSRLKEDQSAALYWASVDSEMFKIAGADEVQWQDAREAGRKRLLEQADFQVAYWEEQKEQIRGYDHDEATAQLIEALKIDSKIVTIKGTSGLT